MRTWHRRLGIAAAVLVAWLALSGLLLGHTDGLRLDERHLRAGWLLDWYGVRAPRIGPAYRVRGHWIVQAGERVYFDEQPLEGRYAELRGAALIGEEIAVAADDRVHLLSRSGALIETLDATLFGDEKIERAASPPPAALRERISEDYRDRILTLERVLLDLHSGRILGLPGVLLFDFAALTLIGLAATGLWLWLPRRSS